MGIFTIDMLRKYVPLIIQEHPNTMLKQAQRISSEHSTSFIVYLLDRRITFMTVPAIVSAIHTACIEESRTVVANYNIHSFNLSIQHFWFYEFLQNAEIAHCDSIGILNAVRYMGVNLPLQYRASYSLLMPELLAHCNEHGLSIFFLGAEPKYLEEAVARVKERYPNIKVDGHHGYFETTDFLQNAKVVQKINAVRPNILIVGMGMPRQENWISINRKQLNVNVIMPGGAVIDRLAEKVQDCPAFLSNVGLEWLYRLWFEPKRLAARYLLGNPAFVLQVVLAKIQLPSVRVEKIDSSNIFRHAKKSISP